MTDDLDCIGPVERLRFRHAKSAGPKGWERSYFGCEIFPSQQHPCRRSGNARDPAGDGVPIQTVIFIEVTRLRWYDRYWC